MRWLVTGEARLQRRAEAASGKGQRHCSNIAAQARDRRARSPALGEIAARFNAPAAAGHAGSLRSGLGANTQAKSEGYKRSRNTRVFLVAVSPDESGEYALDWLMSELVEDGDEVIAMRVKDMSESG